jgi:hypothetical protein
VARLQKDGKNDFEALAMSANELLVWMSARARGSWQQFRAAVEELQLNNAEGDESRETDDDRRDMSALPRYQTLRLNFERLGHAEFFEGAAPSGWRITPPTLAAAEGRNGWRATLVGARTPKVLQRIRDVAAQQTEITQFVDCPDQIVILNREVDILASLADRAGLLFQHNAPLAMLTSLPPIDDPSLRKETYLPIGTEWTVERFSTSAGRWRDGTREDAANTSGALFRFSLHYRRLVLYCSNKAAFQISPQVAKYLLLFRKRHSILRYDASSLDLSVPATYRPPLLVERALILCAAAPPSYEPATGRLHYVGITRAVVELVGALLRQELT